MIGAGGMLALFAANELPVHLTCTLSVHTPTTSTIDYWTVGCFSMRDVILMSLVTGQQRYYGSHYERLQALKLSVDPLNIFRFPTSIQE